MAWLQKGRLVDSKKPCTMSLEILVIEAVNLPNIERFGKIDPYVRVDFKG